MADFAAVEAGVGSFARTHATMREAGSRARSSEDAGLKTEISALAQGGLAIPQAHAKFGLKSRMRQAYRRD